MVSHVTRGRISVDARCDRGRLVVNRLVTEAEALQRLDNDVAAFTAFLRAGEIEPRTAGTERFWPEELALAVDRFRSERGLADAFLAVGRLLATATNTTVIGKIAVRAAALLTGAGEVAIYRPDGDAEPDWLMTLSRRSVSARDAEGALGDGSLPNRLPAPTIRHPTLIDIGPGVRRRTESNSKPDQAALLPLHAAGRL